VRPYDSTVVSIAPLAEEFLRFETGEQTGNVGLGSNHHVADGGTGEPVGICAAQNAQSVVLRGGEAKGFEPLLKGSMQTVCGAKNVQQSFFLGTGEVEGLLLSLCGSCHHLLQKSCGNTEIKRRAARTEMKRLPSRSIFNWSRL